MISCDSGVASFDGNALELSAEVTVILSGLMTTYSKNDGDNPKAIAFHNYLLKSIMYNFARNASKFGYDTNFTESELEGFDRVYKRVYGDDEE